ncbi:MAG: hypothetical protein ABIT01_01390 [Thermoanaerobaculia bacterium]
MIGEGAPSCAVVGAALLVLGAGSHVAAARPAQRAQPTKAALPAVVPVSAPARAPAGASAWSEEIYRLGREALAKASFETAVRLFRILESEPAWEGNASYAFNRAQASRYAGKIGEAVYWFGRYLALDAAASDAKSVAEQIAKLVPAAPKDVRATALERARLEYARLVEDAELARALDEAPRVGLEVRFTRIAASGAETPSTAFLFPARVVFWAAPEADGAESGWQAWITPTVPVAAPEDLNAPALLFLPPGRPFRVALGADLVSKPTLLRAPAPRYFPADPALEAWRIEVVATLLKTGPPLLVAARGNGGSGSAGGLMADVHSGPADGLVALGRKRRDVPREATPIAFGPRLARPDAKTFPKQLVVVLDLPGKDGDLERWGTPIGQLDIVNRFGRMSAGPRGEPRLHVRDAADGPFLIPLSS